MRTSALNHTLVKIGAHAVALGAAVILGSPVGAQSIFINEVHYDNKGKDTGEVVEIAGPAKTDLTKWQLVFYNGKNGRPYRTVKLEGSIPDLQEGLGTLSFAAKGIENGSPDGVALVNPDKEVIHFISYEGRFTASSGVAKGLVSQDIGVKESESTMPGKSIQLKGTGKTLADFQWAEPERATPGAVNEGQMFVGSDKKKPADIATRAQ